MLAKRKTINKMALIFVVFSFLIPKALASECVNFKKGNGTVDNPYHITTNEELYSISCNLNSYFILDNDLDLLSDTTNSDGLFYNNGSGWVSIRGIFSGTFDGNNKIISGLTQKITFNGDDSGQKYGGLFERVSGTVKNLTLENINLNFFEKNDIELYVGGIAGYSNGKIINTRVTGNINYGEDMFEMPVSSPYFIGGIVGYSGDEIEIRNSINEANIVIDSKYYGYVAGITSELYTGLIDSCTNKGNITTTEQNAAGIVLALNRDNSIVSNCKNYGTILADYSAGIVSVINSGKVYSSANYGIINSRVESGGIVALALSNAVIENSFNVGTITTFRSIDSGSPSAGGIAGTSYGTIKNSFNIGLVTSEEGINLRTGGLGGIAGVATGTIENTYNFGVIKSNSKYLSIGNLVGENASKLTNSYYLENEITGVGVQNPEDLTSTGEDKSTKLTRKDFLNSTSFIGFDFDNVWNMVSNSTYLYPQINNNPIEGTYLKEIKLSYPNKVYVGDSVQINSDFVPSETIYKNLNWSVSYKTGEGTITDKGIFTATKAGKVIISAISSDFSVVEGTTEIDILPVPVEKIEINEKIDKISINNEYKFTATISPDNASNKEYLWSIVNGTGKGSMTSEGIFTGLEEGTVTITAISVDNPQVKTSIQVEVVNIGVTDIFIKADSLYVDNTSSFYLKAYVSPSNASYKDVVWSSSNANIATINSTTGGVATKYEKGIVTFTATSTINSDIKASITIYVGYTNIQVNNETSLGSGYTTYDEVVWEIEDENILERTGRYGKSSVNSYHRHYIYVRGKQNGSTTVRMKTISGDLIAETKVYVYTPISNITSDVDSVTTDVNNNVRLNLNIGENVSDLLDELIFISEDDSIASVTQDGVVTGNKVGKTNIYVYSKYRNHSLIIPVNIIVFTSNLNLNQYDVSLNENNLTHQITYSVEPTEASFKNVTYKSENEKIATVNENGLITAVKNGTTKIIVTTEDGKNTKEVNVTISGLKRDINGMNFSNIENVVYTSKEIKPVINITDDDYVLVENVDYTVEYENNINAGIAIINITGINDYNGNKIINFTIDKKELVAEYNSNDVTITYDGSYYSIPIELVDAKDVVIKYKDENGNYTILETPKYKNAGEYQIEFEISKNDNYTSIKGKNLLKINKKDTANVEIVNYMGFYDDNEHSFDITIDEEEYDVRYTVEKMMANYPEKPSFSAVGDYNVEVKITSNNFIDQYKYARIQIFGIKSFNDTLRLYPYTLAITNFENRFSSLYGKINFYAYSSSWQHLTIDKQVIDTDVIKTGDYVRLLLNNEKTYEYQLSVLGDVNGDGKISALDYVKIKNHIMKTALIKGDLYLTASDVNSDGKISALDYVRIKNYIMNGGK